MRFVKMINNNVALAVDEKGKEWIVLGKGVGYHRKFNEKIPEELIKKRFISKESQSKLIDTISNIDIKILDLANFICDEAKKDLKINFDTSHYIALADHLDFALKRAKDGIDYGKDTSWEVKKLFPNEYNQALKAIDHIESELDVKLLKSEETFITYHFINAESKQDEFGNIKKLAKLTRELINITKYNLSIDIDEYDINYVRFVEHLRYFIIRKMHDEEISVQDLDQDLVDVVKVKYKEAYEIAQKIEDYLLSKEKWNISGAEKLYLTLHIWRLIQIAK